MLAYRHVTVALTLIPVTNSNPNAGFISQRQPFFSPTDPLALAVHFYYYILK